MKQVTKMTHDETDGRQQVTTVTGDLENVQQCCQVTTEASSR